MKIDVMTMDATAGSKMELPAQFDEPLRTDVIKRAVESMQANSRQAYGAKADAGARHSTKQSRRRRKYKTTYGYGISRTPRKVLSSRGTRFFWVGAFAPNTVGGRRAHPPKPHKVWAKKLNTKERRLAIRSAMSATVNKELVAARGHKVPDSYPFVLDSQAESVAKTRDLRAALVKLGLTNELSRITTRVRAGRGKMRGRRTRTSKGPLLVVSKACKLQEAAKNIPGVDVVVVDGLNADLLAPGADVGRLTLFTKDAIDRLSNEGLFLQNYRGPSSVKEEKKPAVKSTSKSAPAKPAAKKAVKPAAKPAAPSPSAAPAPTTAPTQTKPSAPAPAEAKTE